MTGTPVSRLLIGLLVVVTTPTIAWTPSECGPEYGPPQKVFRQEVLAAKPGSLLYTPHPYPTTAQEVFEDFVTTYRAIWQTSSTQAMPAEEQRLFTALKKGTVSYKVSTVEDWRPQRCFLRSPSRFHYLVQLFDKGTGAEFARGAVKESGLWAGFQPIAADASPAAVAAFRNSMESFEHVLRFAATFGYRGEKAQYVETGGTLYCPIIEPCVAFQAGKSLMISKRGQLFEVAPDSRRLTGAEFSSTAPSRTAFLSALNPATERVVSLGFDQFAVARLVGQTKP